MSEWLGAIGDFLGKNGSWLAPATMAGASVYGAVSNSNAARTQANALQQAQGTMAQGQQNALAAQAPFQQAGQQALGQMLPQVTGGFQATPGYQWTQNEAMRGVQNSAAANGLLSSGSTLKALQDRSAGLANQEYGTYWNRLAGIAGAGQTATNNASNVYTGTANNIAGLQGQAGNALANGQTSSASALMGGANNLLGYYARTQQPNWGSNSYPNPQQVNNAVSSSYQPGGYSTVNSNDSGYLY